MNTTARKPVTDAADLRHVLRAGTSDLHARVDACFADGLGTPLAYARYLVGMHRFASDFEIVIGAVPQSSYWLANDLRDLSLTPLPPSGVRAYVESADERLGWEYVMSGSSLGARHLLRGVQALGHDERTGARFLARHAGGDAWRNVLDRLVARSNSVQPTTHLMQGARDAFLLVQSCFERSFDAISAPHEEPAA
ncbi:biliverdin-producing heme oxygenase [Luteimonas fraxinea]|uniref:Biliverdin-producing heme oxygenase n=1 Tax=Luteimonas fraxinea TaxID=2901869 RepID=A0ABS8UCV2_9GAMM|nr:biliverdin-producing heme oxygenase [Luteimonas fraxinea]MCD9097328.1 biliverdin-producing heme oxygenase [Luteimonas fraxinea]UHH11589.1 biliverdin-producing heme oxygenase [Luteimonas fraxinea]